MDGLIGASFTATAHVDDAAGGLPVTVQTGGAIAFILDLDAGPVRRYTGSCRISAAPSGVDINGTVTYGVSGTVEGTWIEA